MSRCFLIHKEWKGIDELAKRWRNGKRGLWYRVVECWMGLGYVFLFLGLILVLDFWVLGFGISYLRDRRRGGKRERGKEDRLPG